MTGHPINAHLNAIYFLLKRYRIDKTFKKLLDEPSSWRFPMALEVQPVLDPGKGLSGKQQIALMQQRKLHLEGLWPGKVIPTQTGTILIQFLCTPNLDPTLLLLGPGRIKGIQSSYPWWLGRLAEGVGSGAELNEHKFKLGKRVGED